MLVGGWHLHGLEWARSLASATGSQRRELLHTKPTGPGEGCTAHRLFVLLVNLRICFPITTESTEDVSTTKSLTEHHLSSAYALAQTNHDRAQTEYSVETMKGNFNLRRRTEWDQLLAGDSWCNICRSLLFYCAKCMNESEIKSNSSK